MKRKIAFWCLAIVLFVLVWDSPQGMIFPMWVLGYLYHKDIARALHTVPISIVFIGATTLLGLVTEGFAIWENAKNSATVPLEDIPLLHPEPAIDLFMGLFYYFLYGTTLYLWIQKYKVSKIALFISTGIFGLITEQGALFLMGILVNPLVGIPMALIIMCVYAIFPLLAYLFVYERFGRRKRLVWWQYPLMPSSLLIFWALYGLLIYDTLISYFPIG